MNKERKFLSIVTPTYNRCLALENCYKSLKSQSDYDFEWIVIDDGSEDGTKEYIKYFKEIENEFEIIYVHKKNGGKHTALNESHTYIFSELVLILDSDDMLTKNAVKTIKKDWNCYKNNENICGLSYLRGYNDIQVIGSRFPNDYEISNHVKMRINGRVSGDKAEIIKSNLFKEIKFPTFDKEKFLGEGFLWISLSKNYQTVYINKIIYICEYLEGGLSKSGRELRIQNAKGGMFNSKLFFDNNIKITIRIKKTILYNTYAFFTKEKPWRKVDKDNKFLTLFCKPLGYLLYKCWDYLYGDKK